MKSDLSRREFLAGGGALVVLFGIPAPARAQTTTPSEKLARYSSIDAWLAVGADGRVTVYCGKVELGTGVTTALSQIVAEELDVPVERVTMIRGDTALTPDQGVTAGSKTIQQGGPPLRQAAAEARQVLLSLAAAKLNTPVDDLVVSDGVIGARGDGALRVSYAALIGGRRFEHAVTGKAKTKPASRYVLVGKPVRRVDIPGKITGTHTYVHDVRIDGMLHGRVVRPPRPGATLIDIDEASVSGIPGIVKVVTIGNFVGIVAEREEAAIQAARSVKMSWSDHAEPAISGTSDRVIVNVGAVEPALSGAAKVVQATYRTPFQMHASIGPSCAIADVKPDSATIWSGTQAAFALRDTVASLLGLPDDRVRVVWVEASGCYGHNGADDAAGDAALLSQAVGKPVRVQWMRHDEHGWEPKGPAMSIDVRAGLDPDGKIVAWDYAVTTPTHSTRPRREPGNLLAGALIGHEPKFGLLGGDRNARHTYVFPNDRVTVRWERWSPLRPSALRGLGAPQNTFANESFIDEVAAAAGVDPIEFRLRHLTDGRARDVIEAVARLAAWQPSRPTPTRRLRSNTAKGRGVAYAQYETAAAYVATIADVDVNRQTGEIRVTRVWVAHDCGLVINPDGVRNQIEGNVIQTISRALKEEVKAEGTAVTSLDWTAYPILTFPEVPDAIDIVLLDRPDQMAVGAGEPAACPIPAAIANAVFDATGARLRTMPFTPARVRAALAALDSRTPARLT